MADMNAWKCNACGYIVRTSGPWEFYRDDCGERKPYGHPVARSREARESGIKGLSTCGFCPTCDEVRDVIVREFEKPERDTRRAWHRFAKPDYLVAFRLWFAARPGGFRSIANWLGTMPVTRLSAIVWCCHREPQGPYCNECGGMLYQVLSGLNCQRCKAGVFELYLMACC